MSRGSPPPLPKDVQCSIARYLVEKIMQNSAGGTTVLKEFEESGTICDRTRRQMVNILVAHMNESEGYVFFLQFVLCLLSEIEF